MNTRRFSGNADTVLLMIAIMIVGVVIAALAFDALWVVVGAIAVIGLIIILSLSAMSLIVRFAAPSIVGVAEVRLESQKEMNRHEEVMVSKGLLSDRAGYRSVHLLEAPAEPEHEQETVIDPRHALLVNLCLLTIKSASYGPTSKRLMTADDAQADRSGLFADRMQWDAASKYGQDIGWLFVQRGGNPNEQGLKVDCPGGNTAADLLVELHNRNLILDSGVAALPGVTR